MIGIVIDLVWSWGGCRLVVLVIGMVIDLVGLGCFCRLVFFLYEAWVFVMVRT